MQQVNKLQGWAKALAQPAGPERDLLEMLDAVAGASQADTATGRDESLVRQLCVIARNLPPEDKLKLTTSMLPSLGEVRLLELHACCSQRQHWVGYVVAQACTARLVEALLVAGAMPDIALHMEPDAVAGLVSIPHPTFAVLCVASIQCAR